MQIYACIHLSRFFVFVRHIEFLKKVPEKSNEVQCTFFHHPLLHGDMQPGVATVSTLTSNQRALLPIVQVDIVGTGRVTRKANVLLDSGFRS